MRGRVLASFNPESVSGLVSWPTHSCTYLYFRCGTESHLIHLCIATNEVCNMSQNRFHRRQAAATLLKMAKATTDPGVAAKLVEAAADLKDQAGELPAPTKPPDVLMEE
jgi:hypothetical protein